MYCATAEPPFYRPAGYGLGGHLATRLDRKGIDAAGALMAELTVDADAVKDLAYLLYNICERKRRTDSARLLNSLVTSWADIVTSSRRQPAVEGQLRMEM